MYFVAESARYVRPHFTDFDTYEEAHAFAQETMRKKTLGLGQKWIEFEKDAWKTDAGFDVRFVEIGKD